MQRSNKQLQPPRIPFLFYVLSISVSIILGDVPPWWLHTKMLLPDLGCYVSCLRSPRKNKLKCPASSLLVSTIIYLKPACCSLFISTAHSVGCMPLYVLALSSVSLVKTFGNWIYHSLNLSPAIARKQCFSAMTGLHCLKYLWGIARFLHIFIFILVFYSRVLKEFCQFLGGGNIWLSFSFFLSFYKNFVDLLTLHSITFLFQDFSEMILFFFLGKCSACFSLIFFFYIRA